MSLGFATPAEESTTVFSKEDAIAVVDHYSKIRRIPEQTKELEHGLVRLLQTLKQEILNETVANLFIPHTHWAFSVLFNKVAQLLHYRRFLGQANLNLDAYHNDYLNLCENNAFFKKAIKSHNPFILHEHLINLYNQIQQHTDASNIRPYLTALLALLENIEQLNPRLVGVYHLYLQAFCCYAIACAANKLHSHAPEESDMYGCANNMSIPLCITDIKIKVAKLWLNEDCCDIFLEFYTLGQDLFERTPFQSLEDWENQIKELDIIPIFTQIFNMGQARQEHEAHRRLTHAFTLLSIKAKGELDKASPSTVGDKQQPEVRKGF